VRRFTHAIDRAFYGQGEFWFEDISILNEMMEKYGDDWEMIFLNIKIT
jgi:kynurenine 3-monooxygenase